MKTNSNLKRHFALILVGSIALAAGLALETKSNTTPATPPGITLDNKRAQHVNIRGELCVAGHHRRCDPLYV